MPGIYGVISKKDQPQDRIEVVLRQMKKMLRHRGDYVEEEFIGEGFALGCTSLKRRYPIADVECQSRRYAVLVDGYIYRLDGGSRAPIEKGGEITARKMIDRIGAGGNGGYDGIEGNYCAAVYDIKGGTLSLWNDIFGPRRLYYADLPDMFVFAPEMKAISFLPGFDEKLDWKAIADFFNYGYVLGDETFFSDIRSLPSATILTFERRTGGLSVRKYWRPVYEEKRDDIDAVADRVYDLLRASIAEKVDENDSVINPISGGLDSRLILATLRDVRRGAVIKPITYAQRNSYEYLNAVKVCRALGIPDHQLVEIRPNLVIEKYRTSVWLSEGMIPMLNAHLLLIPDEIRGSFSSVLNGIYGGPTNYSAEYYRQDHINANWAWEEKVSDIANIISVDPAMYRDILDGGILETVKERRMSSLSDELKKHVDVSENFCNQRDALFIENRMRRFICQGSLYRFFWEEQLPLSNYSLYRNYLAIPPEYKLKRGLLKKIILRKFPNMAKIKDANTGLNLYQKPGSIYKTRTRMAHQFKYYAARASCGHITFTDKSGYAHYDVWFRKDKRTTTYFDKVLRADTLVRSGVYKKGGIDALFRKVQAGQAGFEHVGRLATFALWHDMFIEKHPGAEGDRFPHA